MKNKPQKMEKVAMVSEDIENENLQKLRSVFPQFVKDGSVDFDALQSFFKKEEILPDDEKYGLSWAGKSNAFKAIRVPAMGTLVPREKESKNWDATGNIFIEGDNLEVLKLLQKHYRGQIKMIYIDPPYNTGKDFIYKDNFMENVFDYYERTGQSQDGIKMTSNMESNGRYHSDWLTMMYPRLFLARNLLKDDGVIFVSIDDNEVANLRMIMDEIFGEENFVSCFVWNNSTGGGLRNKHVNNCHEYIVFYAKNKENLGMLWAPLSSSGIEQYRKDDEGGKYREQQFAWQNDSTNPNQKYSIEMPDGTKIIPKNGYIYRFIKDSFLKLVAENKIIFKKTSQSVYTTETGQPTDWSISVKDYLGDGMTAPVSLLPKEYVKMNIEAVNEIKDLFDFKVFDYTKPSVLIKYLSKIITKDHDIILDFFAGSGTTAHAVMDLNAEDGGNRKFICVQIPEETDEDSEARKAGYKTIAEISRERIRRAGDKILSLPYRHRMSVRQADVGFKAFSLSPSNYRRWNVLTAEDDEEALLKQAKLFLEKPLVDKYDEQSVIYEILLKEGFNLNSKIAEMKKDGIAYHKVIDGEKEMNISFAVKLTMEQIDSLELTKDTTFVCLDSALDDTTKVNIMRNLRVKTI